MVDRLEPAQVGPLSREALRTPRAAGIAGIAFAVLLFTVLVLVRLAVPNDPAEAGAWLTDGNRRRAAILALNLMPFAGIAFLWFIGVVRDRIGTGEDRLFATVFLGSGLLFIAMLFAGGAIAGGPIPAGSRPLMEPLTEREQAVLAYLPTMLKSAEIASEMFVSVNTVKTHQRAIYRKLGVGNRRDAVDQARAHNFLEQRGVPHFAQVRGTP